MLRRPWVSRRRLEALERRVAAMEKAQGMTSTPTAVVWHRLADLLGQDDGGKRVGRY